LKPEQIRTKPLELFKEAKSAVDLTQAPIIVFGRFPRNKAPENIPAGGKRSLSDAANGSIASDLRRRLAPHGAPDRQLRANRSRRSFTWALGISGPIRTFVGMKGARTIVAINKDQNAPIFEILPTYGIAVTFLK